MKNIFILPTDKQSRLCLRTTDNKLALHNEVVTWNGINQHIYITFDEGITGFENNIWVIKGERIFLWENTMALISDNKPKKIILTTDPTLIEDGIQEISNEFLKWFIDNPNCEKVEVIDHAQRLLFLEEFVPIYKIIIPKENPKTNSNFYEDLKEYFKVTPREKVLEDWDKSKEFNEVGPTVDEFLNNNQETLEEAAKKHAFNFYEKEDRIVGEQSFIQGTKWQAERMLMSDAIKTLETGLEIVLRKNEKMYSYDELRTISYKIYCEAQLKKPSENKFNKLIQEFKK